MFCLGILQPCCHTVMSQVCTVMKCLRELVCSTWGNIGFETEFPVHLAPLRIRNKIKVSESKFHQVVRGKKKKGQWSPRQRRNASEVGDNSQWRNILEFALSGYIYSISCQRSMSAPVYFTRKANGTRQRGAVTALHLTHWHNCRSHSDILFWLISYPDLSSCYLSSILWKNIPEII